MIIINSISNSACHLSSPVFGNITSNSGLVEIHPTLISTVNNIFLKKISVKISFSVIN